MKKKQRIDELKLCANIFELHGHVNTSSWIRFVTKNLEENRISDYHKDYLEILYAFKSDVSKDDFSRSIHDEIDLILGTALNVQRERRFNRILVQSWPLIHNWRKTRDNINSIRENLMGNEKADAVEKNFYVLLFLYLLEVEGSFDDIIRTIYILVLASKNRRINYQRIYNKRLREVKTELVKLGFSNTFFRGWEDGHLRNAIAHARFSFDKETGKMNFVDIIPGTNKIVYNKDFTFQEFAQRGKMVVVVAHIFTSFIMLIRILDLVKYKWVGKPQKAK